MTSRAVLLVCAAAFIAACGSQSAQGPKPVPWKDDPGLAPPSLTPNDKAGATPSPAQEAGSKSGLAPASSAAAVAQPATTPEPDIPSAQPDGLDVTAESLPAGAAILRPCEQPNCGVVLSISGKQRWQIEVLMHGGSVQVFDQDYRPAFQIGDPVLVDGSAVFLWN